MAESNPTRSALDALQSSVLRGSVEDGISALSELIRLEPSRWHSLLFLNGVFPEPRDHDARSRFATILEIAEHKSFKDRSVDIAIKITGTCFGLFTCRAAFDHITKHILKCTQLEEPLVLVARLAALLESQAYIAKRAISPDDDGIIDLDRLLHTNIETGRGGANVSIGNSMEEISEAIELVLRYTQRNPGESRDFNGDIASPYNDAELHKLIILANSWRIYDALWGRIRYLGWYPDHSEDCDIFGPPDINEFLRIECGHVRTNRFRLSVTMPVYTATLHTASDSEDNIKRLAESLDIPASLSTTWDAKLDTNILLECVSRTTFSIVSDCVVQVLHYADARREVKFGKNRSLSWGDWHVVSDILRVIAKAIQEAVESRNEDIDSDGCVSSIVRVDTFCLSETIAQVIGMESSRARSILDTFIFDANRRDFEIWDQPLIPVSKNEALLVPSILLVSDPTRAMENFISQWNGQHGVRGPSFQSHVANSLRRSGGLVAENITFMADDRQVEYDIVMLWEGNLFLVETKCLKSIHSAADEFRARNEVNEAFDQLARRKRISISMWSRLREAAPELSLPAEVVANDRIHCIAVSNAMQFTGWTRGELIATDDSCLSRYFDSPFVPRIELSDGRVTIHQTEMRIRDEAPNPRGLMEYLRDPPQVRDVMSKLRLSLLPLVRMSEDSPKIAIATSEFLDQGA